MDSLHIRPEQPGDAAAVRHVNEAAFGRPDEADLVERLREKVPSYLALVATRGGEVVGHIAFTPVSVAGAGRLDTLGLAPMAVLPAHQRAGIGSALVRAGLAACREAGAGAVVVLGYPAYYPRFGFTPAGDFGILSEYDVPPEAFMALELVPGALAHAAGVARYHAAFGG